MPVIHVFSLKYIYICEQLNMFFVSGKFVTVGIHCMGAEKLLIIQERKFF